MAAVDEDVLKGFGINLTPNEFVLGTFDSALTVFDQQVRALNLVYRLHERKCLEPDKHIAVIGGGIAGLTFAAGCLWLGYRVLLLEKQPVPCHLQRGCDIRWIHPHIYHWPRPGSEQPYAGLPLLSWEEGSASEVARQITSEWDRIRKAAGKMLTEVYSAKYKTICKDPLRINWTGLLNGNKAQQILQVSHLVYAVGFGVEQGHTVINAHSYWENDSFNQLKPDHPHGVKRKWLVSGIGDGALLDLQRLTIESFRQRRVVQELFANEQDLVEVLRQLASQNDYYNFHSTITDLESNDQLRQIDSRLRSRQRVDTAVTLNARRNNFEDAINNSTSSFLNRFVVHRLHAIGAFEYLAGDLWKIEESDSDTGGFHVTLINTDTKNVLAEKCDEVVLRHGTKRHAWLREAGYPHCVELEGDIQGNGAGNVPEWAPGWWSRQADENILRQLHALENSDKLTVAKGPKADDSIVIRAEPREFITPVTEAVATTFVRTLASIIKHSANPVGSGASFRVTLHRVIPLNGQLSLQQISEYAGTRLDDSVERTRLSGGAEGSAIQSGTVGRVFNVNHLAIGLCVRSRRPCIMSSKITGNDGPAADLTKDMNLLHFDDSYARQMNSTVKTILTVPFFGATWKIRDNSMVNLVLYIDSDNQQLLSNAVIDLVRAACISFREHLDELIQDQEGGIRAVSWDLASAVGEELQDSIQIPNMQTFVNDPARYSSLLADNNLVDYETLKFKRLDVIDLVAGVT